MNGPQDLGGQMGFGPVAPERNEPVFHADWERRALGVTLAAGAMGHWTIDESRHARESLHPADYYASSYYEIWIKALEVLLQRHGLVAAEELSEAGRLVKGTTPGRVLEAADVPRALARACSRPVPEAALMPTMSNRRTAPTVLRCTGRSRGNVVVVLAAA